MRNIFFGWNGLTKFILESKNRVGSSKKRRIKAVIPLKALGVRYHDK
jgi:hypothetical protein